jgi:type I restriction enzyme S subunit
MVPVSELATAVIGGTPSRNVAEYWHGDIPWATAKDVAAVSARYLEKVEEHITCEGLENSAAKLLPKSTVVITARGTVGAMAQLGREMAFNQTCYALLPKDGVDNDFLFYALKGTITEMRVLTYGTVFETITTKTFDHWLVPLPPLPEQRAIAHILGTLDDKIELNRRMSETLEAMARALFKSWFVDFDPVCAKAEGSDPGLPQPLADLFPDSFEDSELGEIPKGWEVLRLADLLVESDQRIGEMRAPEYSSTNHGLQLRSERFKKTLATSSAKNKLIRMGYLVFGLSRRVLNFGLMRDETGSVSAVYKVFKVREEILSSDFLERLMRLKASYFYTAVSASSREGQSVSSDGLKLLRVVVPPRAMQEACYLIDSAFNERIIAIKVESRTLAALRDTLLPKLISGEMRVKDAERFLKRRGL